jgi:MoaA/NifB/PqqE/SkfB family radical SAM enzyme
MRPTGRHGILQLHPTRRCNLSCLHCYSESGPGARDELASGLLRTVIADAADLGYTVLSVSGGEPLMYRALPELLEHARAFAMRTLVTTNGTLTTARHLTPVVPHLDLLAISLDGPPAEHDQMRARAGAFDTLAARMDEVRATGVTFGFLFTLTQHNVHQLDWAVGFALEQGAALLQIHPLAASGRATALAEAIPDEIECAVAVIEVARLRQLIGDRLRIHLDLTVRSVLPREPDPGVHDGQSTLVDLPSPMVIEPDGRCGPLEYGFPSEYALGNVTEHRLRDLATTWRQTTAPRYQQLLLDVHNRLNADDAPLVADWYAVAGQAARAAYPPAGTPVTMSLTPRSS